jgi:hypothetical protein
MIKATLPDQDTDTEVKDTEDYGQILATSPNVEDGLHLGVCEYGSCIWTATVIMYEFSMQ